MTSPPVYLDYAATTPMDPEVIDAMHACTGAKGAFANPGSTHPAGRRSAAVVHEARCNLGALLNVDPTCLVWTSGATESDNLAIRGAAMARAGRGQHLVTMPTEHKAVVDTFRALEKEGFEVTWLEPDRDGILAPGDLERAIREDTQLVSIMHVNNETGTIQDIPAIGAVCRANDVLFHVDAAQSVGKLTIELDAWPVDLLSLTAHKFYGPQGIGALYVADRPGCGVFPLMYGGGQEKRLRPGTLPVHLIAGIGVAATVARSRQQEDLEHVAALRERLWQGIQGLDGLMRNGSADFAYPGILNVCAERIDGESLMLALEPLCVASGSACNSTSGESSYVLRALGRSDIDAQSAVRFSFGRFTTTDEIEFAIQHYRQAVTRLRSLAPAP
jgi:cysteine desulfurase